MKCWYSSSFLNENLIPFFSFAGWNTRDWRLLNLFRDVCFLSFFQIPFEFIASSKGDNDGTLSNPPRFLFSFSLCGSAGFCLLSKQQKNFKKQKNFRYCELFTRKSDWNKKLWWTPKFCFWFSFSAQRQNICTV